MVIKNDYEKILNSKELKDFKFMKYSVLFIRNVKRDDKKNLLECSIIAMIDDINEGIFGEIPDGTEEVFLTSNGTINAFGFLGLGWF